MSPKHTTSIVALGVFILVIGLILTPLITASNTDTSETRELVEGNTTEIGEHFTVTINTATNTSANVTVQDTKTLTSATNNLSESQSSTDTLSGGDITTTVTDVSTVVPERPNDPDIHTITVRVAYSRTYSWSDEGILFAGQLDVILALIGFMTMIAVMVRVIFA